MNSNDLIDQLAAELSICSKCGKPGSLVCIEDVSGQVQEEVQMDETVVYLHCNNCNEYTPVMGLSGNESKWNIKSHYYSDNSISRNAACTCGSGKKYKRCCGKK